MVEPEYDCQDMADYYLFQERRSLQEIQRHYGVDAAEALRLQRKAETIQNARMAKRGYSREFKPHGDTGKRYLLDKIPAGLWSAVQAKCKREGVSIRALVLKLLTEWVKT